MATPRFLPRVKADETAGRRRLAVPARLTWKDASGAVRFLSAVTREIGDADVVVECDSAAAIPLYRLVHLQVERPASHGDELPIYLREGRVLSAVWQVGPCRPSTGTPSAYALKVLVDPRLSAMRAGAPVAVAS